MIDSAFLNEKITDFTQHFNVCGPPNFVITISNKLTSLGAETDAVVF